MYSCIECQMLDMYFNKDNIYIRKYWITGYCCFFNKNREYGSKICKHFVLRKAVIDANKKYEEWKNNKPENVLLVLN